MKPKISPSDSVREILVCEGTSHCLAEDAFFREALVKIQSTGCYCVCVIDPETEKLKGIITDGDLRRTLLNTEKNLPELMVQDLTRIMTPSPISCPVNETIGEAFRTMSSSSHPINAMPVVSEENHYLGMIRFRDVAVTCVDASQY